MTLPLGFALILLGLWVLRWLLSQIDHDEDCWNHDDYTWLDEHGMTLEEQR